MFILDDVHSLLTPYTHILFLMVSLLEEHSGLCLGVLVRKTAVCDQICISFGNRLSLFLLAQEDSSVTSSSEHIIHKVTWPSPDVPVGPVTRTGWIHDQQGAQC